MTTWLQRATALPETTRLPRASATLPHADTQLSQRGGLAEREAAASPQIHPPAGVQFLAAVRPGGPRCSPSSRTLFPEGSLERERVDTSLRMQDLRRREARLSRGCGTAAQRPPSLLLASLPSRPQHGPRLPTLGAGSHRPAGRVGPQPGGGAGRAITRGSARRPPRRPPAAPRRRCSRRRMPRRNRRNRLSPPPPSSPPPPFPAPPPPRNAERAAARRRLTGTRMWGAGGGAEGGAPRPAEAERASPSRAPAGSGPRAERGVGSVSCGRSSAAGRGRRVPLPARSHGDRCCRLVNAQRWLRMC